MSAVLTQEEVQRLVLATVTGGTKVGRPPTTEQIEKVVEWATIVRVDAALLKLVLDGEALPFDVEDDGEFRVTLAGREAER